MLFYYIYDEEPKGTVFYATKGFYVLKPTSKVYFHGPGVPGGALLRWLRALQTRG